MIETIDLTKKYGDFSALESLNLKLEQGDLFGFIGPTGAGKTTLLAAMPQSFFCNNFHTSLIDASQICSRQSSDTLLLTSPLTFLSDIPVLCPLSPSLPHLRLKRALRHNPKSRKSRPTIWFSTAGIR